MSEEDPPSSLEFFFSDGLRYVMVRTVLRNRRSGFSAVAARTSEIARVLRMLDDLKTSCGTYVV